MKGINTLKLNQQTMCEALQVWLDQTLAKPGAKVTEVKGSSTQSYGSGSDFEVIVAEQEKAAGA